MYYSGISLLKVVAMLSIVCLHILGHGGILGATSGPSYSISYFLEILCLYSVNAYALTTGFLCYKKKHTFAKYFSVWCQVVFYGLLISITLFALGKANLLDVVKALLPFSFIQYWYFMAYTGVCLLMPLLDKLADKVNKKSLPMVFFSIFALCCYNSTLGRFHDPFRMNDGYGIIWLSILYFVGALIKKFEIYTWIDTKKKRIGIFAALLGMVLISWGWKVYLGDLILPGTSSLFTTLVSPTIFGISVGVLLIFCRLNFRARWMPFFSSSTFGVYLIHDSNLIRQNFMAGHFAFVSQIEPIFIVPTVIFSAIIIFLICIIFDKFRMLLFKILRIYDLSRLLESVLSKVAAKVNVQFRCK